MEHPENLKDVNRIKISDEIRFFNNQLSREVEDEKSNRTKWDNAVDKLDKLRYGVKGKKNHPWPGCANYKIPVVDNDIRKLKPSYVNLSFGVSPICTFVPYGPEDVEPMRKRELLYDWRLRTKVDFFKSYCIGVDHVLGSMGQTVFRTIWKYTTRKYYIKVDINEFPDEVKEVIYDPRVTDEMLTKIIIEEYRIDTKFEENIEEVQRGVDAFRQGETEIELECLEEQDNRPEVTACNVKDDLVVPMDTKDINDARFIDYKFWITKNDLKIAINNGKYEKYDDYEIDSWLDTDADFLNEDKSDGKILMHETCCWKDINNDGIAERCISTWPDRSPESVLRFIELPYEHGQWPYVQVKREILDDNFYTGRGLPSLKEDFQKGISTAVNQAIDNGTLLNSPERVARQNILSNPRNRRYIPGELTEVNGDISQYEVRQYVNSSQPVLFQQAQYLKSWSDQTTGLQTAGLSSNTDMPGFGEHGKKTAREVSAYMALASEDKSLDLLIFQQQMSKVHFQIDALYYQYGDEEEEIQITGKPPLKVSRYDIQGKFNIVPNGRLDNSNPQMRLQKAVIAFNYGYQNPFVKQRELTKSIFEELYPSRSENMIYTEEEIAQMQQQQMMQQQKMIQEQIGLKKVSDDLDIRKAALLEPIEGKPHAPD